MPNSFANRLKKALEIRGITAAELSRATNTPESVISQYKNGLYEPKQRRLQNFSEVLQVSIPWLMGADVPMDIKDIENKLVPLERIKKVPILGKIACGTPILAEENIEGYIILPDGVDATYALTCKGDSMIDAGINDGDTVFIKSQPDLENGEIGAVMVNEEATLKKVYKTKDVLTLAPANPSHEPLIFVKNEINQITILGKAVAFLRVLE